jgi:hypothetical protein
MREKPAILKSELSILVSPNIRHNGRKRIIALFPLLAPTGEPGGQSRSTFEFRDTRAQCVQARKKLLPSSVPSNNPNSVTIE